MRKPQTELAIFHQPSVNIGLRARTSGTVYKINWKISTQHRYLESGFLGTIYFIGPTSGRRWNTTRTPRPWHFFFFFFYAHFKMAVTYRDRLVTSKQRQLVLGTTRTRRLKAIPWDALLYECYFVYDRWISTFCVASRFGGICESYCLTPVECFVQLIRTKFTSSIPHMYELKEQRFASWRQLVGAILEIARGIKTQIRPALKPDVLVTQRQHARASTRRFRVQTQERGTWKGTCLYCDITSCGKRVTGNFKKTLQFADTMKKKKLNRIFTVGATGIPRIKTIFLPVDVLLSYRLPASCQATSCRSCGPWIRKCIDILRTKCVAGNVLSLQCSAMSRRRIASGYFTESLRLLDFEHLKAQWRENSLPTLVCYVKEISSVLQTFWSPTLGTSSDFFFFFFFGRPGISWSTESLALF